MSDDHDLDAGPDSGPDLGTAVRRAREASGLTVEQVSARTKIRPAVLRDLETGGTGRSGGAAYARGHLRAIAAVTGADPDVLLAAHDRQAPDPASAAAAGAAPSLLPGPVAPVSRPAPVRLRPPAGERGPRWGLAGAAAALVLSALLLLGVLTGGPGPTPAPAAGPTPPGPTASPPAPTPAPPTGAALRLQVSGADSWVSVRGDGGGPLFVGVLAAGTTREFADPERLSLTVGNAGAVRIGCGGEPVAAGGSGQVRRFVCGRDGLAPA